jgi:hypothetical protein
LNWIYPCRVVVPDGAAAAAAHNIHQATSMAAPRGVMLEMVSNTFKTRRRLNGYRSISYIHRHYPTAIAHNSTRMLITRFLADELAAKAIRL